MNATTYIAAFLAAATGSEIARQIQQASPWWHLTLGTSFNTLFFIGLGCFMVVLKNKKKDHADLLYLFLYSFGLTSLVIVGIPEYFGYKWPSNGLQACVGWVLGMTSQNWGGYLLEWGKEKFQKALGKGSATDE